MRRLAPALLALCCTAPGAAQTLLGPRAAEIPEGRMDEKDRARVSIVRYATCLVGARPRTVVHALDQVPGPLANAEYGKLSYGDCLSQGQLRFAASLLRGPLFIALYRRDFGRGAPTLAAAPIDFAKVSHLAEGDPQAANFVALRKVADCTARADPAAAHEAVMASPTSPAERMAFTTLLPRLGGCLPGGQHYTFNKMILAGLLAEVMYRDAQAAAPVQAAAR